MGKLRPREVVTNTMFSDMHPWQKQDQNSDLSLTSKVKLPALPHALRVKGTRRGIFTPSDLSFHTDRLSFPMASAWSPHCISWQGHIQHQPLGVCSNLLLPEAGEGTQ